MPQAYPVAQTTATVALTFANGCFVWAASAVGLLLFIPSAPIALACGVLATLADLEVNRITIRDGLKKMIERDYLLLRLTRHRLLQLYEEKKENEFLRYYKYLYDEYQALKDFPLREKEKISETRENLRVLERYFVEHLRQGTQNDENSLIKNLCEKEESKTFEDTFRHKQRLIRASWIINLSAGVGTGFITAYSFHAASMSLFHLLHTGLAVSGPPTLIIPIAVAAGAWYAIITFNNLHIIIADEVFQKKWKKVKDFFSSPEKSLFIKILAGLGLALILGLGLFMTIATAGTWLYGIRHGALLLHKLKKVFCFFLALVFVPFVAIAAFLFNFNNFLKTVWEIKKFFIKMYITYLEKEISFSDVWNKESWYLRLNPFRLLKIILELPFKILLFIGHVFSMSAIANRIPQASPLAASGPGMLCEAGEDTSFLIKSGPGVLTYFVAFVLLPITFFDALWRWAFKFTHTEKEERQKSFGYFFKKSWGIEEGGKHKATIEPEMSDGFRETWTELRIKNVLTHLSARYDSCLGGLAREKRAAVNALLEKTTGVTPTELEELKTTLSKKRWGLLFAKESTYGVTAVSPFLPTRA